MGVVSMGVVSMGSFRWSGVEGAGVDVGHVLGLPGGWLPCVECGQMVLRLFRRELALRQTFQNFSSLVDKHGS